LPCQRYSPASGETPVARRRPNSVAHVSICRQTSIFNQGGALGRSACHRCGNAIHRRRDTGAGAICEGTVHGLSLTYSLARGTGFLAVRAGPSATAPMIHQLFNGDTVEITDRRGSWYFVGVDGFEGWAHRKWMSNSCGY
jgi:hypothetical protein